MTKEEFYTLATNRPAITGDSIYKLTIREIDKNTTGFKKDEKTGDWCYEIGTSHNWYTSKDKAVKYMLKYIQESDSHYRKHIHSALIERIPANTLFEDGGQLEWWLYDKNGKEIDRSVCTWEINEEPSEASIFMGRLPEEIKFKMGDIVEIVDDNKVFLSVINGLPSSIEEIWKLYEKRIRNNGNDKNKGVPLSLFDAMADMYFYIQANGFDPDTSPYHISKPSFPVPEKAKEILTTRYDTWQSYMDSHSHEEINWEELYALIREKACK
ncbi:MAG: hypothetical protein J1E16_00410 [Muribaculaceae bacterium]|nr:hypothetical protein [Muribaculaceae bacterium]